MKCIECGKEIVDNRRFNDQGPFCKEHHILEMANKYHEIKMKEFKERKKNVRGKNKRK